MYEVWDHNGKRLGVLELNALVAVFTKHPLDVKRRILASGDEPVQLHRNDGTGRYITVQKYVDRVWVTIGLN